MTPSSGARSGTPRNERRRAPFGDGRVASQVTLRCGHTTEEFPTVSGKVRKWFCPEGCGLQRAK